MTAVLMAGLFSCRAVNAVDKLEPTHVRLGSSVAGPVPEVVS